MKLLVLITLLALALQQATACLVFAGFIQKWGTLLSGHIRDGGRGGRKICIMYRKRAEQPETWFECKIDYFAHWSGDLSTIRFACCGANRNWAWGMNFIDYEHFVYVWNNVEHVSGPCDCDGFDCEGGGPELAVNIGVWKRNTIEPITPATPDHQPPNSDDQFALDPETHPAAYMEWLLKDTDGPEWNQTALAEMRDYAHRLQKDVDEQKGIERRAAGPVVLAAESST